MRAHELVIGRTFLLTVDHGENLIQAIETFCKHEQIRQGYIPMFLCGLMEADVVGTCDPVEDIDAPVWRHTVLHRVEALGCGTLAYDATTDRVLPHIHISVGVRERGAVGYTSHLYAAQVQFVAEMTLVEVTSPRLTRRPDPGLYGIALLCAEDEG